MTGFGYDHDDAWATNIELFKEFTDVSRVKKNSSISIYLKFIVFPPMTTNSYFIVYGNYEVPIHEELTLMP